MDDGGAASVRALLHWQYRTICRGPNSILQNLYDTMGPKAHDYISFYGLRAHGRLSDGGPLATNQVKMVLQSFLFDFFHAILPVIVLIFYLDVLRMYPERLISCRIHLICRDTP